MKSKYNCLVLLGPTAVGKTALAVRLAYHFGLSIISADSRQVYRGLDIGSGKDLADYTLTVKNPNGSSTSVQIPYYLIDIADLSSEYNAFKYQEDFYSVFTDLVKVEVPFVVGGTGMYLDAVIRGYDFVPVPTNTTLRAQMQEMSLEQLDQWLLSLKPNLHNKSDLLLRDRVERAIEIEVFMKSPDCQKVRDAMPKRPDIRPLIIGTSLPREDLRKNIKIRLDLRLKNGMIEEVENLHKSGISWERLEKLGLEYRYLSLFLEGKMSRDQMEAVLYREICHFAKRQETWFRGMERKGVEINWLPPVTDSNEKYSAALKLIEASL